MTTLDRDRVVRALRASEAERLYAETARLEAQRVVALARETMETSRQLNDELRARIDDLAVHRA